MAAQSLAMGGSVCKKKSFGNVRLQPGQKPMSVSLNPLTVDMPNARLAKEAIPSESRNPSEKLVNVSLIPLKNNLEKARLVTEAMSSESQKLLQGDTILSFTSIFKDSLDTDEDTAAVVTADILHQWMTESVMEIVRHVREAPFLYYIFERNVSSETPRRHKLPQDSLEGADDWPVLRDLLRNVLPDGVVLVKKLDDNSVTQSSSTSESGMSNEMKGFDKVGSTNVWGLLIQGRGAGVNACYILKTTEIISAHGYHGKVKPLFYDVVKIIVTFKGKRGEHRLFRLAENLCINLILSSRDIFLLKKDFKGPTELTETLNRIMVMNLAITIKTRGVAEFEQMVFLQPLLEQLLGTSQHVWSEKTIRHFPPLIREALIGRVDKRAQSIQAWQQAENTVINQCTQLLSPSADPTYVVTYINHSFPQHRQYLCAGAWIIMDGHPETINTANLGRVLKELSPEEVTSNIYTMVDVLLHHIQLQLQRGYTLQELLLKSSASLAFFMWTHELLPVDIVLLALIDRDDDLHALRIVVGLLLDRKEFQQRVKHYCTSRGPPEHWANHGPFQRNEPQQLLGNHLAGKDRYPVFFDDMVMRALPVIPLITYRLIENDATDTAEKVLAAYLELMVYHPFRFTFVREILAYFHGLIPIKLIARILSILDIPKIPFSEAFLQYIRSNSGLSLPPDYFTNILLGLLNKVIPPIRSSASMGDSFGTFSRTAGNRAPAAAQSVASNVPESQKVFYQNQDPGTYSQLLLETAVIEILSLCIPSLQIVSTLVQIVVHVQPTQAQSSHSMQSMSSGISQSSILPASPSAATADSMSTSRSAASVPGLNTSSIGSGSNSAVQASPYLMIQACGLLLAQLPPTFHIQFYAEATRIIKDCWWLTDVTKSSMELDTAFGYALWDPTWAFQDNTSTTIGNLVALVHAFFSNLPHEWLEGTHAFIKNLRPITTIAQLRLAFRIMGPLLPRLVIARPLFKKTLALLFSVLADVFGRNSQTSIPVEPTEISDLIDFLHHAVMYEAQGGAQNGIGKPKPETLSLCSKAVELLRPELQHLLRHLTTDVNSSIYASTHPRIVQRPPSPLVGAVVI